MDRRALIIGAVAAARWIPAFTFAATPAASQVASCGSAGVLMR